MSANPEQVLSDLMLYCASNDIKVHTSIGAQKVAGAGLGVYSMRKIKSGEQIVHVPTKHIFTIENIPEHFLPKASRQDLAVHAQLAAFFAFGGKNDLYEYEAWMATWPELQDFTAGMPIFWDFQAVHICTQFRKEVQNMDAETQKVNGTSKRRKVSNDSGGQSRRTFRKTMTKPPSRPFSLSPALSGRYSKTTDVPNNTSMLSKMSDKLISHIRGINTALPHLNLVGDDQQLTKFLHAWCLVNTRCFYFFQPTAIVPPNGKRKIKPKPPADPNEAMALCPFMDLFNHTAPPPELSTTPANGTEILPCKVKCDAKGFTVTTQSSIPADTEILLSYGAHTNDILWSEYGFLLSSDTNSSDSILLDEIILNSPALKPVDKTVLEEHGYLGDYTLHNDGTLCYRTEMAAWLVVLGRQKWAKVISEGRDPEAECTSPFGKGQYSGCRMAFVSRVVEAAEDNIEGLQRLNDKKLVEYFGTMIVVLNVHPESDEEHLASAKSRRDMCTMRWQQIKSMAERGIKILRAEIEEARED